MAAELKEAAHASSSPLTSDQEQARAEQAWHDLLAHIHSLVQARGLKKSAFISYAWPPAGEERDRLQAWLKQLQDNLEYAGITTFLDLRDMHGNLDATMRAKLEASDFVIPVLTPRFLERAEDPKTNLSFEFNLTLEKAKANPASVLPILYACRTRDVLKGPLAVLSKHLIYSIQADTRIEPNLVNLSPLGLIPTMYGIRVGDQAYESLLTTWRHGSLTRLPKSLSHGVERRGLTADLFYQPGGKELTLVQVIQGIGGVGKTQLANTYAHYELQRMNGRGFVRWILADPLNLTAKWLRLGELLGLDLIGLPEPEQHQKIRSALQMHENWLIVLDGLENEAALQGLLPEALSPTQKVLITTRSQHWIHPTLAIPPFTPEETQTYFALNRLSPHQEKGKNRLAKALGYLPLALTQAVAYMKSTGASAENYHTLYQEKGISLFADDTFLSSYQQAIEQLAVKNPLAAELVKFCAYFPDGAIDERHIKALLNLEDRVFDACIADIRHYGLLTRSEIGLTMHPFIQEAIRAYEKTTCTAEEIATRRLQPIEKRVGRLPLPAATLQALQSSVPFFQSAASAGAAQRPDVAAQKITALEAQLAELERNREAALAETAIPDDEDYPAVKTTEELSDRIQKLEEIEEEFKKKFGEEKFKERFQKKQPIDYQALEQCRISAQAILALDKEIQKLKEEHQADVSLPATQEAPNKGPALVNEVIIEGEICGDVETSVANAENVPEALGKDVIGLHHEYLKGGVVNKTALNKTGIVKGSLKAGMLNLHFAPSASATPSPLTSSR